MAEAEVVQQKAYWRYREGLSRYSRRRKERTVGIAHSDQSYPMLCMESSRGMSFEKLWFPHNLFNPRLEAMLWWFAEP